MSDDGANMGVLPNRALDTILGKGEQPTKEERLSPIEMRKKIMRQPDKYADIKSYEEATLWLAKQFLILLEEGVAENDYVLFEKMVERNGTRDYDFTGFMVGYANNVARYC